MNINDPNSWSTGKVRHLVVGHLIHEYQKGKCVACKVFSTKLEHDPYKGLLCPKCLAALMSQREKKNFFAFVYCLNGKEKRVVKVGAPSRAMLSAELTNYLMSAYPPKKFESVWHRDASYLNGGYYEIEKVGKFYLKEK